jgi:hypothetical protein
VAIVGALPAFVLLVISLLVAIFSVWWAATIYVVSVYIAAVVILISCRSMRPPDDVMGVRKILLSSEGERLFTKYYAFFVFPLGTQNFAHFINYARGFGILWIAIGLWQRLYWLAIANVVFYMISGPLIWWLSPIAHYKAAAEKGSTSAVENLQKIKHILDNRDVLGF